MIGFTSSTVKLPAAGKTSVEHENPYYVGNSNNVFCTSQNVLTILGMF